jgi:PIN domain nuclease of toxin-antitoxin system
MQIKVQLGKLKFDIALPDKVSNQQEKNDIQILPIVQSHIYAINELPHHHRDPFDRVLIAQATSENLYLVSHDAKIAQYDVQIFWDVLPEE